jgi:membrane-bound ClpP family serine protease
MSLMKRLTSARSFPGLVLPAIVALLPGIRGGDPGAMDGLPSREKVLLYPIRGVLTEDVASKVREDIRDWLDREPDIHTLFLEIDSAGTEKGRLGPAEETARFLADLKGVVVVARIFEGRAAGNASALLALAARDILMSPNSRLGFVADEARVGLEVQDGDPKAAEEARGLFQEFGARRPGGPIGKSHLAAAMVSGFHPIIYKVRFTRAVGNDVEEEVRFLTQDEINALGPDELPRKRPGEFPYVQKGQKLTLDPAKAKESGIAVSVGSDDYHDALLKLNLPVGDEDILNHETGVSLKQNPPSVQWLIDFLLHPVVRFFLILAGTLGLLLEFKLPGTMIPSLVALGCFVLFLISGLFQPTGAMNPTSVWEIILFLVGMGLLAVELLLLPGVLVFGLAGAAACLIAIVLALVPPSGSTGDYRGALATLVLSSLTSLFVSVLFIKFLPRTRLLDRSGIVIYTSIQGTPTADSAIEAQARSAGLLGKVGMAITPLRPSGTADIDGERVDVVAEGDFVEKGEKIQIIELDGTRTIVRKV